MAQLVFNSLFSLFKQKFSSNLGTLTLQKISESCFYMGKIEVLVVLKK